MCTAVTYRTMDHYFGRNLDLEYSYHETVTVTPRNYPFDLRLAGRMQKHFAMIGMAYVAAGYPLYYDATNEKGLSMAGLSFPDNAFYAEPSAGTDNICPFEFIPWILGQCADVGEARALLDRTNLVNVDFSPELPLSPLHWMISDRNASIVVEAVREGIRVYDNPVGVLTNSPTFDYHMINLTNYRHLTPSEPENRLSDKLELKPYSGAMGALGLPGDLSSASRFVRAAYTKLNSVSDEDERSSVGQFFHILDSVSMVRGSVLVDGKYDITVYSSCCNTDRGIYYYKTYDNSRITGVDMYRENLDGTELISYELIREQQIEIQN